MKPAFLGMALLASCLCPAGAKEIALLNVSYDPTRELYQEFNTAFARHGQARTGDRLAILKSHGASARQARSVIDGQRADGVTLAEGPSTLNPPPSTTSPPGP